MSKALFFNALPDTSYETGYDRNYNADDLSDFLSIICDTGVVKTNTVGAEAQGLKVVAASGMTVNVNAGKAVIKGKGFINDALESLTIAANGTATNRYDYVVIKFDNNIGARNITLEVRTGTSSIPTASNLANTDKVKELMLAYITVAPSVTSISQTNITDTRGNAELCPWFTAVKGYDNYYDAIMQTHESTVTLPSITNTAVTDLPSKLYNERYSLIEVYTNGIKELEGAFTASVIGGYIVITFTAQKAVGTKITVILNNFIDGEGMGTALAQYTQFVQDVTELKVANEINYLCNGANDNIAISNLVKARLNDSATSGEVKVNIIGNIGMTAPALGTGTTITPYAWFDFAINSSRKVILDFTRCSTITPPMTLGTINNIWYSTGNLRIIGASVRVINNTQNTSVRVFNTPSGVVSAENCTFYIKTYNGSYIATKGTFIDCHGTIINTDYESYCFSPASNGFLKIVGGEYYAYTGNSTLSCAVVDQSAAEAVTIIENLNAPKVDISGFYQTHAILQQYEAGYLACSYLISPLYVMLQNGRNFFGGLIPLNKPQTV